MTKREVLVLGDWMVDQYYLGTITRQSPEAPIPVVKVEDLKKFPGGAGNVYANLQDLGVRPTAWNQWGNHPIKNRLMVGGEMLARWDEWDWCDPIDPAWVGFVGKRRDAVVVADYGKGAITPQVVQAVVGLGLPTYVDTKQDPTPWLQCGKVTMFPNHREYERFMAQYDRFDSVILKCGPDGVRGICQGEIYRAFPALASGVKSVVGAGDTVIAAYAVADLESHPDPIKFASVAAAIAVEKPFTSTATLEEVQKAYKQICPQRKSA